jgi:NADH-quinone oxidoreductase subunit C
MGLEAPGNPAAATAAERIKERFPEDVVEVSVAKGENSVVIRREAVPRIFTFLKEEPGLEFDGLVDLTAVDYLGRRPRFDVVYHLLSFATKQRLRVKVRLDESDVEVPSLTTLWGSANWLEREVWDMYGIRFTGHPNLKRLLMYEEFQGHPLRKDYPVQRRQPLIGPGSKS